MHPLKLLTVSLAILALTACSTNASDITPSESPTGTPTSATASPPETSFSAEAVILVTQAFYDEYMDCMTNPPAEAIGQVGNWCSSNNSNATTNFPANLEAGGVAEAGADPIVCAQSFPMSYIVEDNATYSSSEKTGKVFVTEQFGSGELMLTVLLSGAGDKLLVENIVCPIPG
jgi:hypothetical protein